MTPTKNVPEAKSDGDEPSSQSVARKAKPAIKTVHLDALMSVVHQLAGAGSERPTNDLDVRQRMVVQSLGLHGPQSIAVIGSKLGRTASTMTRMIDGLESLGIVARRSHPTDRRVTLVNLTELGLTLFDQERVFYRSLLEATVSGLGESSTKDVLNALAALGSLIELSDETSK